MGEEAIGGRGPEALSRREFAIIVAGGVACTALPAPPVQASVASEPHHTDAQENASSRSAEAEAQYQVLLAKYGTRLSDEQKADIRRLIDQGQKSALSLRSFHLYNSDEPANVFQAALRS